MRFRFLVFSQNSIFPTSAFSSSSDLALWESVRPSEVRRHVRAFSGGRNSESKDVGGNLGFETCPNINGDLGFGDYPNLNRVIQRFGNPESKHVGVIWGLEIIQISN